MNVKRIIPEIVSIDVAATRAFYCGLLGLQVDMEWKRARS
jgi:catechol 2,3-dioxygenase-like lactoylglutathione lyase family enzyme